MPEFWQDDALQDLAVHVPCQWACPALVRVPAYIRALHQQDPARARDINVEDVLLPGVLGRICTRPCEPACRHGRPGLGEPVAICGLKRAAADLATEAPRPVPAPLAPPSGRSVAVVGAGPAGLAVAWHLGRLGHRVTLIEARDECGGLPLFGIPAFRLPPEVTRREIRAILAAPNLEIRTGVRLGRDTSLAELRACHDAVVLATGCQASKRADIPGEDLPGVRSGLDFVIAVNGGATPAVGRRVVVLGGGFTAVDCARLARRLGAEEVTIAYRREVEDARWPRDEVSALAAEGVVVLERVAPVALEGDGRLQAVRLAPTRLLPDPATGLRVAVLVPGEGPLLPVDTVVVALGQAPEPDAAGDATILHGPSGSTTLPGVFAAGDLALGPRTVVEAIGHGAAIARAVDAFLHGRPRLERSLVEHPCGTTGRPRDWDCLPRVLVPALPVPDRIATLDAEVERGLDAAASTTEAQRCYLCDLVFRVDEPACVFCDKCIEVCPVRCIHYTRDGRPVEVDRPSLLRRLLHPGRRGIVIDSGPCTRCGACVEVCPVACIRVTRIEAVRTLSP